MLQAAVVGCRKRDIPYSKAKKGCASMCEGHLVSATQSFDPKRYLPDPAVYTIWPSRLYDFLRAGLDQPARRAMISIGLAAAEYLVGLSLAALAGFAQLYVSTFPVYVLCAAFGFFMGRARWLTVQIPERIKCFRLVFDVPDGEFRAAIERVCHIATNRWITVPVTAGVMLLMWLAVGEYYLGTSVVLHQYVAELVAPTFPAVWHEGPHLLTKMLIIDLFLGLGVAFAVPIIYGSMSGLVGVFVETRAWRVVPLPSYVSSALRPAAQYLFYAATYYAVAVGVIAILYAGRVDFIYFFTTVMLSAAGMGCLLGPYVGIRLLIDRARQQLGEDIASTYYREVWPVGSADSRVGATSVPSAAKDGYARLLDLEKLMHAASDAPGLYFRVEYILQGALIQLSPTLLALTLVAIFARDRLLQIFLR